MSLSNISVVTQAENCYITKRLATSIPCCFTSNFCGNFYTHGSCMSIKELDEAGWVQVLSAGANACNAFFSAGTSICFAGNSGTISGYLFD